MTTINRFPDGTVHNIETVQVWWFCFLRNFIVHSIISVSSRRSTLGSSTLLRDSRKWNITSVAMHHCENCFTPKSIRRQEMLGSQSVIQQDVILLFAAKRHSVSIANTKIKKLILHFVSSIFERKIFQYLCFHNEQTLYTCLLLMTVLINSDKYQLSLPCEDFGFTRKMSVTFHGHDLESTEQSGLNQQCF